MSPTIALRIRTRADLRAVLHAALHRRGLVGVLSRPPLLVITRVR